jgi:hypothetical protein
MKKYLGLFGIVFLILSVISFTWGSPYIFSDGYGYYHVAKSLIEEGNFVTPQKPEYYEYSGHGVMEYKGNYVTVYSPGNAIYWLPFLSITNIFDHSTIYNDYSKAFNGHSLADGIAIQFAGVFYTSITFILIVKILEDLKFKKRSGTLITGIFLVSTFALVYATISPAFSHTYELFSFSLLLFALIRLQKSELKRFAIIAGLAAGMLVLTRPFNIVILLPILLCVYKYFSRKTFFRFIISAVPFAIIYLYYNYVSYGSPFANGYSTLWDQNFVFAPLNLFYLLFSDIRGLFFYTPIAIFALVGLYRFSKSNRQKLLFIAPALIYVFSYSFWPNWWAGDSIGQRFFIVLAPLLVIGFSAFIRKPPKKFLNRKAFLILTILFTVYSSSIVFLHRITPTASLGKDNQLTQNIYPYIPEAERFTTFEIINYHVKLVTSSNSISDYGSKLMKSFNGGRSLLMLQLGMTDPLAKIERIDANNFNLHIIPSTSSNKEIVFIELDYIYLDKQKSIILQSIDTSKYQIIKFKCSIDCIPENINYSVVIRNKGAELIKLDDNLYIGLQSEGNIKFVDYKLKQ